MSDDDEVDAAVVVAERGRVIRRLDPVLGTSLVGTALPAEQGIPFGVATSGTAMSRSLLVMARLTGVRLVPADLAGRPDDVAVGYCR